MSTEKLLKLCLSSARCLFGGEPRIAISQSEEGSWTVYAGPINFPKDEAPYVIHDIHLDSCLADLLARLVRDIQLVHERARNAALR